MSNGSPVILLSTLMTPGMRTTYSIAVSRFQILLCALLCDAGGRWFKPHFCLSFSSVKGPPRGGLQGYCGVEGTPFCPSASAVSTTPAMLLPQSAGSSFPEQQLHPAGSFPALAESVSSHPSFRDTSVSTSLGLSPADSSSKLRHLLC